MAAGCGTFTRLPATLTTIPLDRAAIIFAGADMSEITAPETAAPSPAAPPPPSQRPRRLALVLLVIAAGVAIAGHWLGGRTSLIVAGVLAGIVVLAAIVWRLPHLRRHFARPPGAGRRPSGFTRRLRAQPRMQTVRRVGMPRRAGAVIGRSSGSPRRLRSPGSPATGPSRRGLRAPWRRQGSSSPARQAARARHPAGSRRTSTSSSGQPRRASTAGSRSPFRRRSTGQPGSSGRSSAGRRSSPSSRSGSQPRGTGTTGRRSRNPFTRTRRSGQQGQPGTAGQQRQRRHLLPSARRRARAAAVAAGQPVRRRGLFRRPRPARPAQPGQPIMPATRAQRRAQARALRRGQAARTGQQPQQTAPAPSKTQTTAGKPGPQQPPARTAGQRQDDENRPGVRLVTVDGQRVSRPSRQTKQAGDAAMNGSSTNAAAAVQEAFNQHIAGFDPQSRSDVHGFFQGLPELFRDAGRSFTTAASRMEGKPIQPAVIEALNELGGVVSGIADHAEQAYQAHLQQHDLWLND